MNTNKFGIKNFRIFDENGQTYKISPISILTGCNSSGKSSTIKALDLLSNFFEKLRLTYINGYQFQLDNFDLQFNEGKHNLGTFDKAFNKNSSSKEMSFMFSMESKLLNGAVDVELVFIKNTMNQLNNGKLANLNIIQNKKKIVKIDFKKELKAQFDFQYLKQIFISIAKDSKEFRLLSQEVEENKQKGLYFASESDLINEYGEEKVSSIEKIIELTKYLNKRDDANQLIEKCTDIDLTHNSLFYLPVLDWLKDVKKQNVNETILNIIENSVGIKKLNETNYKLVLEDYHSSDIVNFVDYYLKLENEFLEVLSNKIFEVEKYPFVNDNDSFISDIANLIYPEKLKQIAYTQIGNLESIEGDDFLYKFTNVFASLASLCREVDEKYSNERVESIDLSSPENGMVEIDYFYLKEIESFVTFIKAILQDSLLNPPVFIQNIKFVDSVRANIQRLYTFNNQGTQFNETLLEYSSIHERLALPDSAIYQHSADNERKQASKESSNFELGSFIRKWLNKFEIADDFAIETTSEGLGILIYLIKNGDKQLLADQGFGITQLIALLIKIEINIVKSKYIYSHPFILELTTETRYKSSTIAIEEPETNLHPKFQSLLADLFMDAYTNYNIRFIIETHSEYLIRKLQYHVAKSNIDANDISLYYLNNPDKNKRIQGIPQIQNIKLKNDGTLSEAFGNGFFDEADNLAMELLYIKTQN